MLSPGATIGILGGGQLGRMLAIEAARLGFRCIGYAPEGDNVAAEVCADFFVNRWDDGPALAAFASQCDAVTLEFENVPLFVLEALPSDRLAPGTKALAVAQDRLAEKRFVEELGGRTAPFASVETRDDLAGAIERVGMPGILKTRRDGYDGKGQWRLSGASDIEGFAWPDRSLIYEGLVAFEAEFSVIAVRGRDGAMAFWESPDNRHESGILARSLLPAPDLVRAQQGAARDLARAVAQRLDYVGVLTLEFFATRDGPVFNEMAPRVHNSGHWTIEGAITSQFANHIRAVAGLPLGDTSTTAREVVMTNLIGAYGDRVFDSLAEPGTHLHLYGKAEAREGRKMGHTTRIVSG